jgi:aspartate carbamoyltransferase catalytic subunit
MKRAMDSRSEPLSQVSSDNSSHLLSIADLDRDQIEDLLRLTDTFVEVGRRPIPKVPALRGRTVVMLFFEDSTRTRLSFETAAKRLSADTMSFSVSSSSLNKGESVRDTIETIEAMGIDAVVVRHKSSGVPAQIARWTSAAVINAGDGWHQHPTQALLDAYTARSHLGSLEGRRIAIVGDIKHSRVARSNIEIFTALGAEVTLVAPRTLLPSTTSAWAVELSQDLDAVLPTVDVCYLLRMQQERMTEALVPSLREYTACYGLTSARADQMADGAIVMHPGPMNRGVEIASEVADRPNAVITEQVANGVAVRSAVLFHLLSATRTQSNQPSEQLLPPEQLLPSEHAASNPETVLPEELAPLRNPQ